MAGVILAAWYQDRLPLKALGVFLGSGLLGSEVFKLPLQDPLFPLLSGLFCIPALLISGNWQSADLKTVPPWKLKHAFLAALLSGFSVLLPALSPAFIGALAYFFIPKNDPKIALLIGFAIASSKMVFDFLAAAVLHKARSAPAAIWLEKGIGLEEGSVLIFAAVLVFSLGLFLVWVFRNKFMGVFRIRIPPAVLVGLLVGCAFVTGGPLAVFVLAWASAWSSACLSIAPRKYLLGSLMVPVMMYAFGKFF